MVKVTITPALRTRGTNPDSRKFFASKIVAKHLYRIRKKAISCHAICEAVGNQGLMSRTAAASFGMSPVSIQEMKKARIVTRAWFAL
jgi:hypothetical protein